MENKQIYSKGTVSAIAVFVLLSVTLLDIWAEEKSSLHEKIDVFLTSDSPIDERALEAVYDAAACVVEAAEEWTGAAIFGDESEPLHIAFDASMDDVMLSRYRFIEKTVEINLGATRDVVAHESAHAAIHRLKPGWRGGAALILHEGLADAFTFLTALRCENTASRILETTGGNLELANEASEIVAFRDGSTLRSALSNKSLRDYTIDRNTLRLYPIPGSPEDPHFASVVLTAAIYDAFLRLVNRTVGEDSLSAHALRSAADDAGRIMVAALQLSNEHRATLESYSTAFLDAAEILYGEEVRNYIRDSFYHRGLVNHTDAAREAIGRIFTLSVDLANFDRNSFVRDLLSFDEILFSIARGPDRNNHPKIPILQFDIDNMYIRRVVPSSVRVFDVVRNPISAPGGIYVRVEYEYEQPGQSIEDAAKYQTSDVSDIPVREELAYAGYLFDKKGGIVAVYVDRPL